MMKLKAIKLISWSKRVIALTLSALVLIGTPSCASKQNQNSKKPITFVPVTVEPSFKGGPTKFLEFIGNHIDYPQEAIEQGLEGKVYIRAIVKANGRLTQVKVARSVAPSLDKEAIRLVKKMPKWIPAKGLKGENVARPITFPITFRLLSPPKAKK